MKIFLLNYNAESYRKRGIGETFIRGKIQQMVEDCAFNTPYKVLFEKDKERPEWRKMSLEVSDDLPTHLIAEWKVACTGFTAGATFDNLDTV